MALKFYTSVEKGLKLKVKKFWWLIPTFLEVTGEKLVECGGEGGWQGGGVFITASGNILASGNLCFRVFEPFYPE